MEGDFAGSPRVNVGLLALGTLLASCIGTTGASMLMVRPVIKMNSWRKRKGHIMIFFTSWFPIWVDVLHQSEIRHC